MADFGVGETIAASSAAKGAEGAGGLGGLAKGAETAGATGLAGAADALAPAAAAGAPLDLLSFGSAAGTAVPAGVGALEGFGGGALASGLAAEGALPAGAAGIALPGGLDTGSFLPGMTGGQGLAPGGNAFDNLSIGAAPSGAPTSLGTTTAPPASAGASAVAPPPGVSAPVDATSVAPTTGGFNAIDAAAGQAGVNGAPGAAPASAIDKLLGSAGSAVSKNPIGTALAVGGLGYNILQGQQQSGPVKALEAQAAQMAATGNTLQSYLQKGTLPPGIQAQVQQATAAARARILQNYANTPGGADPTKNSALAQELNNLDLSAIAAAGKIEQDLMTQGISASGLSSNIYSQLAQIDATQTANIGKSIAAMAAALSPTKGLTINTGQ